MTDRLIHLGYELGTGAAVAIPLKHMAVTGQTQESGKTTTLEALISRGDLRAVAFVTKRAEGAFRSGRRIQPYFRERADWQFVSAVLEATLRERLKFERSWIMRACKGATTLAEVHANVRDLMAKAKGLSADVYMTLDEYLKIVIPQIERLPYTDKLTIDPGLNVVDLGAYSMELQALVIRSVLEWIYEREHDTVTIIPEAWEFIPQNRASPVLLAAEQLIRKGAAARNFMWLDSQDIAGVHKNVLRSVIVWILGVQRENNEVRRMLEHVPSMPKPTVQQVMQLKRGQFYACWSDRVVPVYVQPTWIAAYEAGQIARGIGSALAAPPPPFKSEEEDEVDQVERKKYEDEIAGLRGRLKEVEGQVREVEAESDRMRGALKAFTEIRHAFAQLLDGKAVPTAAVDIESIVREVVRRIPQGGGGTIVVQPPEALRKEFQQKEVERVLAYLRELPDRPRDAVRLLEASGEWVGTKSLAQRLGAPTGGDSFVKFSKALNELASDGYIERQERQGVHGNLRKKLDADLEIYQPTPDELAQVYAACITALTGAFREERVA